MGVKKDRDRFIDKCDFFYLAILLVTALGIGIYIIIKTLLIAKYGVFYIEQAQKFSSDPTGIIKSHPPGYPFMILTLHKFITLFSNTSTLYRWILSAQSASLLCRLLALIPLYFIGKLLVGSKESFLAILILVILPYPAQIGCDALREWPYILFLAGGFFALLWGAKHSRPWAFGLVGLIAGAGHLIRDECAQLALYGAIWLLWNIFRPKRSISRVNAALALVLLIAGFLVPAGPYIKTKGKILPPKLKQLPIFSCLLRSEESQEQNIDNHNKTYVAASLPGNTIKATYQLVSEMCEILVYFFVPALLLGFYYHFQRQAGPEERFFLSSFILLNFIILVLLYCNYGYISRRHCLPLATFLIFYVPMGLRIIADLLSRKKTKTGNALRNTNTWFVILLTAGILLCLPKLLRPIRIDKQAYREVSQWLKENSRKNDLIAVTDHRISFYAERKGLEYKSGNIPTTAAYVVKIEENEGNGPDSNKAGQKDSANTYDKDDVFLSEQERFVHLKGLVGYWPANSNAGDYSGHNNHGILQGKAGYAEGKYRQAFALSNVTNGFIDCGIDASTNIPGDATYAAWIKPAAGQRGNLSTIVGKYNQRLLSTRKDRRVSFGVRNDLVWDFKTTQKAIPNNEWTYLALVSITGAETTECRLYINGVLEMTEIINKTPQSSPAGNLIIGATGWTFEPFNGLIDEVMVFNRALSANEIKALYDNGIGQDIPAFKTPVRTGAVAGYWKMREKFSVWMDNRRKKRCVIYKVM